MIAVAAAARLATLGLYPLMDTTEARYAEIARRMVELGDWVTPWIGHGEPFWGKPPLSFWMTAASFKIFGMSAFTARLPHWLCGCMTAWLIWTWLARRSEREAIYALAVITGSVLFYVAAGAVMTDMALALGTTLAMRGFWLALHGTPAERLREQYVMFLGIVIGMLSKGPIAVVLVCMPIAIWALAAGQIRRVLRQINWGRGIILVLALVAPWYAWAEWRTPGFLEYFLVGEHWHRFMTPGWSGDLYGHSHPFPRGSIWLFTVVTFLPWTLLVIVAATRWRHAVGPAAPEDRSLGAYLLIWALTPCLFFSAAGNLLWTYVLPGLPALAMLTALWLNRVPRRALPDRLLASGVACTALVFFSAVVSMNMAGWGDRKSTKALISDYELHRTDGEALVFLGRRPYSGAFYSEGQAEELCCEVTLQLRLMREPVFVAITADRLHQVPDALSSQFRFVSRRGNYQLFLASRSPP